MKNKKLQYILIITVVIIWGLIIYRIIKYSVKKPSIAFNNNSVSIVNRKSGEEKDTFSIYADYRNPFFKSNRYNNIKKTGLKKKNKNEEIKNRKKKKMNKSKNVDFKKIIDWPTVKYCGIVQNYRSGKKVGLIEIKRETYLIQEKDTVSDIYIKKMYKDSVEIIFSNVNRTYFIE